MDSRGFWLCPTHSGVVQPWMKVEPMIFVNKVVVFLRELECSHTIAVCEKIVQHKTTIGNPFCSRKPSVLGINSEWRVVSTAMMLPASMAVHRRSWGIQVVLFTKQCFFTFVSSQTKSMFVAGLPPMPGRAWLRRRDLQMAPNRQSGRRRLRAICRGFRLMHWRYHT